MNLHEQPALDLSVSIVTYNSAHCIDGLARAVNSQRGVSFEIFFVDNANCGDSERLLAELRGAHVTANPENVGFGAAHNQNRGRFRGRHLLFLNPDVTFDESLFARLVEFLDLNPTMGIVGAEIIEGTEQEVFAPRKFYPGEGMVALEPGLRREHYAWVSGACLAVRRELFEVEGGFDPSFFLYQEEADLCLRVRRAGYQVGWCRGVQVFHAGRQSQRELNEYEQSRKLFEGTLRFWAKHYPPQVVPEMVRWHNWAAAVLRKLHLRKRSRKLRSERLRARRDVCAEWLHQRGLCRWPRLAPSAKIVARQAMIAWEWLRTGRFPLDDY